MRFSPSPLVKQFDLVFKQLYLGTIGCYILSTFECTFEKVSQLTEKFKIFHRIDKMGFLSLKRERGGRSKL